MEQSIKVPAEEVLREGGKVRPHNYLQLAGVNLAIAVGSVADVPNTAHAAGRHRARKS